MMLILVMLLKFESTNKLMEFEDNENMKYQYLGDEKKYEAEFW